MSRFCCSLTLLVSLIGLFTTYCMAEKFCDGDGQVSTAFIINDEIHFGDGTNFWRIDVKEFKIEDKQSFKEIWGTSKSFATLLS